MFGSVQNIWPTYSSLDIQDVTHRFRLTERWMNGIFHLCVCVDLTTHQGCDNGSKWCLFKFNMLYADSELTIFFIWKFYFLTTNNFETSKVMNFRSVQSQTSFWMLKINSFVFWLQNGIIDIYFFTHCFMFITAMTSRRHFSLGCAKIECSPIYVC
jgi:hypothetical protein